VDIKNINSDRILLPLPKEFSFAETLHYLSKSSVELLHRIKNGCIEKLLEIHGTEVLVEVSQPQSSHLQLRFLNQLPPTEQAYHQIVQYVCEWLDLETDVTAFYQLAKTDPLLRPLVERYHGLRIVGIPDLFEALTWAVIGQQIHLTFAFTLKQRLIEHFGTFKTWRGEQYWLFPKPSQFDESAIPRLRRLQFPQKKAEYIVGIAQEINSGRLSKDKLRNNLQQAERQLCQIRGIGPWTANYAMMRCFRDPSAFPIADVGLHHALKHLLQRKEKPTRDETKVIFARWKNWEAYAVFYLWRSLDDV
jgi:DNA-3-methyladenine glycosylase II